MLAMLMGVKNIAPAALAGQLDGGRTVVIDVNAQQSWLKARVPGALSLGVEFDAAALPPDRSASLVFYCSNPLCSKAPRAARRAGKLGYTDVRVMAAGITGWIAAGLPTDSGA
ncbi:rhodanese-like domain-containing protein [Massilia yuzhufengensis]|uniref:Rhodanese-related sulfurtransferase n=1 Tax=Massilia yuzhufengensis TaxID=1164594 RepID=A0A1I1KEE7_9BURK|nr:rhodanese-like domain-containing protein [Massilia yuzhufengensis]SFC55850.1 Rhodanese-related sulfurtransferase [Massilia yuzhufengensis]